MQKGPALSECNESKGFAPILILVGILVLAMVAGGVYLFSQSQAPKPQPPSPVVASPTPQATLDETANWKTYTGKASYALSDLQKSGLSSPPVFSIKYPADWTNQTFSDDVGHLGFIENGKQYKVRLNGGGRGLTPDPDLVREDNLLVVDKYTGTKSVFKIKDEIFLISADIGNQFFSTNFVFDVPPTNQEKYTLIFDLMLSTFKFTDQNGATNINPTTEELMGFQIYPKATYLGKQPIIPCANGAEQNGFSTCNAVVYSWKTADDWNQVTSWYRQADWICGGAGTYTSPRDASTGGNTCTKNNRRFGTFFDATALETRIDFALYP